MVRSLLRPLLPSSSVLPSSLLCFLIFIRRYFQDYLIDTYISFDSSKSSKGSESLQVQRGDRYVSPQVHWKPETQSMICVWQGLQRTKAMLFSLLL